MQLERSAKEAEGLKEQQKQLQASDEFLKDAKSEMDAMMAQLRSL